MKTKNFLWLFVSLFLLAVPAVQTYASGDEVEIELFEVSGFLPGDNPLDDSEPVGENPTRPNDFRATINGHALSINKLEQAIPSAQATVVNAATGGIVLNQQFSESLNEQITNTGVYVLHIETAGGALVGQFVVQ